MCQENIATNDTTITTTTTTTTTINKMTSNVTTSSLAFRRESLLRRQMRNNHRLTSFRLPKETTPGLLHFHAADQQEDYEEQKYQHQKESLLAMKSDTGSPDISTSTGTSTSRSTTATTTALQQLERRRSSLLRCTKQQMTSFRLPKELTHHLLTMDAVTNTNDVDVDIDIDSDNDQDVAVGSSSSFSTPTIAPAPAPAPAPVNIANKNKRTMMVKKKNRRCWAMQKHKEQSRMASFRLPKEQTKTILHQSACHDLE